MNKSKQRHGVKQKQARQRRLKFSHIDTAIEYDVDTIIDMMNNGKYPLSDSYAKPYRFSNGKCLKLFNENLYGEINNLIKDITQRVQPEPIHMHLDDGSPIAESNFNGCTVSEHAMLKARIMTNDVNVGAGVYGITNLAVRVKLLELANGFNSQLKFNRNGLL